MPSPPASTVVSAALAAAIAAIAMALLLVAARWLPQDRPNPRSLHDRPVPRVGGLAIWAGFLPLALIVPPPVPGGAVWLAAWFAVATVSLLDDWRGVRAVTRLGVQAIAAGVAAWAILGPLGFVDSGFAWGWVAAATIVIVWSANLFNFMDGSDGLAAVMAICGFAAYGVAATRAGTPAAAYFALAAATLPFLAVNVPPARAFMGDVGAVPLGFLAGLFGIAGVAGGEWPAWFPLLVFLPFVADATATLVRRLARGEPVGIAHRSHYYQRLNQLGAGHRGTLAAYGALIIGAAVSALGTLALAPAHGWAAVALWIVVMAAFFAGIDYHWNRRRDSAR